MNRTVLLVIVVALISSCKKDSTVATGKDVAYDCRCTPALGGVKAYESKGSSALHQLPVTLLLLNTLFNNLCI